MLTRIALLVRNRRKRDCVNLPHMACGDPVTAWLNNGEARFRLARKLIQAKRFLNRDSKGAA